MEKGRYMLIFQSEYIYRFKTHYEAQRYANANCSGIYKFYIIVDTEKNEIVEKWSY